jgi:hypothetical protein
LLYCLTSMGVLSLLALGVSAVSAREKSTPAFWFMWWILAGVVGGIATQTRPWLQHLSFNFNLEQIALAVFRLGDDIKTAQESIPILGNLLRTIRPATIASLNAPALTGAVLALLVMCGLAIFLLHKKVRPE